MRTVVMLVALSLLAMALTCHGFVISPMEVRHSKNNNISTSSELRMTLLTYGNKKKDFKPGTPMKKAVAQLGIKPKYSCNKGDCATCQVLLAGQFTKPCVAKVPPEPKLKSLKENGLPISL